MAHSPCIIVVGGGIIGSAIAYHLALAGAPPLVVDETGEGGLATAASFAWINASWGNPEPYFRLRMRAIEAWRRLGHDLPELPLRFTGSLTYDIADGDLDRFVATHADWGYRVRMAGPKEIAAQEPALREMPARAALVEDEGMVEPAAAALVLRRRAEALGARFVTGKPVRGLVVRGGEVVGVRTDIGEHFADEVVLAAGIATPRLAADAGYTLPLETPEGLLLHTRPLPPVLNGLVIAPEMHVRQTTTGALVAGFDFVGSVVENADATARRLATRINEMFAVPAPAEYSHTSIGLRPTPRDGFPVIGRPPATEGLYLAVMHSGVTLAPLVGALVASEIVSGERDPGLTAYHPGRFG